ncbi:MAG: UDP-N-acetylmuramoyl-L-alanine--D-glutamate ligase, partial [Bacteroidetes bacterium]|nr:UDP-N-acetylmuramoyl-L-alanine--D-glutamate ligase [Bacteroidota bacterium]
CGEVDGVKFINDSKATNVDSVYYALDGISQPIVWIAGGIDKGNDYTQIADLVKEKVRGLVCLGVDNGRLSGFFRPVMDEVHETTKINEAVQLAKEMARPGDVILLSPACASFDLFKNYEDRGDQFKEVVASMVKPKRTEV